MSQSDVPNYLPAQPSAPELQSIRARLLQVVAQLEHAVGDSEAGVGDAVAGFLLISGLVSGLAKEETNETAAQLALKVDAEIQKVMIAFQFHDLLKQRLAHAVDVLRYLSLELGEVQPTESLMNSHGVIYSLKFNDNVGPHEDDITIF